MPTQITATAETGKDLYAVIQQGTQVYPALSPVGAVVTPSHPLVVSIEGLPEGWHVVDASSGDSAASDNGQYDGNAQATYNYGTNLGGYALWLIQDENGNDPTNNNGLTLPYTVSSNDADYTPGTPIPPPSLYRTDTHAFETENDANYALYAVPLNQGDVVAGSQVYPAVSPVGAVQTPTHSINLKVIGLPAGVTVVSWTQDNDKVPVSGSLPNNINPDGSTDTQDNGISGPGDVQAVLSNGVTLYSNVAASQTEADYNPGIPIPPPQYHYAADFPSQIGPGEYSYSVREVGQVYPALSPVGVVVTPDTNNVLSVVGLPSGVTYNANGWAQDNDQVAIYTANDNVDDSNGNPLGINALAADNGGDSVGHVSLTLSNGQVLTLDVTGSQNDADYNPGTPVPPPPGYAPSDTTLSTAAVTIAPSAPPTVPSARRSHLEKTMTVKLASTPAILFLLLSSTDHVTPLTGAAPAAELSKAGAAFAAPEGAITEVGLGWYKLTPTAADTDALGTLVLHATAAGADPASVTLDIVAYDPADAAALGLTRLDATISSRLAETDYIAPTATPTASAVATAVITAIKADTILAATFNRAEGKYTYNPATHVMTLLNDDGSAAGTVTLSVDSASGVITGKQ